MKKKFIGFLKIFAIGVAAFFGILFLLPILFPGKIAASIKQWTNQSITGELNFSKARLSFFRHFPTLTLSLHDFSLTGSEPFAKDTLLAGEELSFGIRLNSLFSNSIEVDEFYIDNAQVNVLVDENGKANYNIYKGGDSTVKPTEAGGKPTRLEIKGIFFSDCRLRYEDQSIPMIITADGFNYEGRGDLAKDEIELNSTIRADSFDLVYAGTAYLQRRKLEAELATGINTSSLAFKFHKNNLVINKLPVDFSGSLAILKNGYDIDLHVISGITDFANIFTALPPDYEQWFKDTRFSGTSQVLVDLAGPYRSGTQQAPDLDIRLSVKDGMIDHNKAPAPLEHFTVKAALHLPKLNTDSLSIESDSLHFLLNNVPTSAKLKWKGMNTPYILADIKSRIDLALLDRALGLSIADLEGELNLDLHVDGYYRTGLDSSRLRPDTVIQSIPAFDLKAGIKNGYYKHKRLPMAVEHLQATILSSCATGRWQDIRIDIPSLQALIGKGKIAAKFKANGMQNMVMDADVNINMPLENLANAIPMKGYQIGGDMKADLKATGTYNSAGKKFPVTSGQLALSGGHIQTPYYPQPIEQLNINGKIESKKGSADDLQISLQPIAFRFEGQPFEMQATLANLNDLQYDIKAKGTLDLGKIYQVFAVDGYRIKGLLRADLSLTGLQSDIMIKRISHLRNKGTLSFENLEMRTDLFPHPFTIPTGTLRFDVDKAWLQNLQLHYLQNSFHLDGYAQNIIGHYLNGSPLYGRLKVTSDKLVVDDFMAFAGTETAGGDSSEAPANGVVLLPVNLDLALDAAVKEILYGQSRLNELKGRLALKDGRLLIQETQVGIAGATIGVQGAYTPIDPRKAAFTLDLKADSFDVKRAYHDIPLFREMASAAGKADGMISVKYALEGRLNDQMMPVYPSIKGKGEVKLEKVKINGLKLFSAVSKATGKDSINNPDLNAVILRTSIKNNIITLQRTKMKIFGFRPRIEGQTSLNGDLNLRFRLGLPPFGIIGIPMTVTGNSENPIVKIRKGTKEDELDEEEDEAGTSEQ